MSGFKQEVPAVSENPYAPAIGERGDGRDTRGQVTESPCGLT